VSQPDFWSRGMLKTGQFQVWGKRPHAEALRFSSLERSALSTIIFSSSWLPCIVARK